MTPKRGPTAHTSAKNSYEAGRNIARAAAKDALITAALAALPDNATENAKRAARDAVVEPNYTVVMVQLGMKKIIEDNAPFRVLAQIKRFLRRLCRKPSEMKFREFVADGTNGAVLDWSEACC